MQSTEDSAFHAKSSSAKGLPTATNVSSNKRIPDENGVVHTEAAINSVSRDNKTIVTLKNNKKMKILLIGSMLDPTISFISPCKGSLDTCTKVFCLQRIHTGVKKQMSNNSSIELYQTVMEGTRGYHNTVLSGIEVNHLKLVPPSQSAIK